jgi:hypothetical protein
MDHGHVDETRTDASQVIPGVRYLPVPVDAIPASVKALEVHGGDISLTEGPHQCVRSPVPKTNAPGILKLAWLMKGLGSYLSADNFLEEALRSVHYMVSLRFRRSSLVIDFGPFAS